LSSSRDETDDALTQRWSWLEEWVGFQPFDKDVPVAHQLPYSAAGGSCRQRRRRGPAWLLSALVLCAAAVCAREGGGLLLRGCRGVLLHEPSGGRVERRRDTGNIEA
jgi:hypothetical protein